MSETTGQPQTASSAAFRFITIKHAVGELYRNESLNVGIFLWSVATGDYRVRIDVAAVERMQQIDAWERAHWAAYYRLTHETPERFAAGLAASFTERLEMWAAKPLSDASIMAWLDDPHFGSYSSFRWVTSPGVGYHEDWEWDEVMEGLLTKLVRPQPVPESAGEQS